MKLAKTRSLNGRLSTPLSVHRRRTHCRRREAARTGNRVASTLPASPAPSTQLAPASNPSITPFNSATRPCASCARKISSPSPLLPSSNISRTTLLTAEASAYERQLLDYACEEFKRQLAAGVPIAMGSDVGPFPHGTQAREFFLMVKFGMSPLAASKPTCQRRKVLRLAGSNRRPQARLCCRYRRCPRQSA